MADTTPHVGGDHWSGWIADCPCNRCAEGMARAKARKPLKLRVVGGEDGSGRLPTRPSERPGGWANERLSLRSLAVALEHLAG